MSTTEKKKGMRADMPEMQALISQRIQEKNYKEVLKEIRAFSWSSDDPCVFRTVSGNLWIAAGHVSRKSEVARFSYKNFLCICLLGNGEDGIAAYLDLQTAAWKGVELIMFDSHSDGLCDLYGTGNMNDRELLYRFFGRNYVFTIGFQKKDEKEQALPGDRIFVTSIDVIGFGEIDKDGKLAIINRVMSYEEAFENEELKPMWGVLAMKLFTLKWNGYRESVKDWKALDILLQDTMRMCTSMEIIVKLDDQKRKHPGSVMMNPQMALLRNEAAIRVHNEMDERVKGNLLLLEWAINHSSTDLFQEFELFVKVNSPKGKLTPYDGLIWLESMLKEMEQLFRNAADEEENVSLTKRKRSC